MTYEFQPRTIPWYAWEHLKTLPAGAEISTAELAAAIGQEGVKLGPYLSTALSHGALRSRKVGKLAYWALGDGTPAVRPTIEGEEDDEDEPARPAAPRPKQRQAAAAEPASPRRSVAPEPAETPCDGAHKQLYEVRPMRVALWSDGTLQIDRGPDGVVLLTVDETRQLVAYLDRMAVAE